MIKTPPTIHITNWSSRKLHGPGRKLTIMARPRTWERGDGSVPALTPPADRVIAAKAILARGGDASELIFRPVPGGWAAPGNLKCGDETLVEDGDTLCCACSREAASKRMCHRYYAAKALAQSGWSVVLDGVPFAVPESRDCAIPAPMVVGFLVDDAGLSAEDVTQDLREMGFDPDSTLDRLVDGVRGRHRGHGEA